MASRKVAFLIAVLVGSLPALGFWLSGLFDLDEGYYAAVVGEMNRRGEWITPYYNGQPWFEKPILLYWLAKPCVMVFGEAGGRLPSFLCLLGLLLAVGLFARRFGERVAILAPLVLGGMLLPALLGRLMMTDMPLCLALTLALIAAWSAAEARSRIGWAIAGAMVGIGVLAKGPIALILFAPPAIYAVRTFPRSLSVLSFLLFLTAMIGVTATWYVPAYLASGDLFVQKFLIEQNIGRFSGGDAAHTLGFAYIWLYLPIAVLGALPFTPWAVRVWRGGDSRHAFLRWWALWTLGFFSISGAKLPHYILPLFPPLALLVAERLAERRTSPRLLAAWCAGLAVLLTVAQGVWYERSGQREAHAMIRRVARDPDLVLFQLSRRQRDLGTGKPKIQETSLPSLLFVADRSLPDLETWDSLAGRPRILLFTRIGRDLRNSVGLKVQNRTPGEFYEVVELSR